MKLGNPEIKRRQAGGRDRWHQRTLPGGGIWGTVMAPVTKCAAERRVVLVYTRFRSLSLWGWFALWPLVRFAIRFRIERLHCNDS